MSEETVPRRRREPVENLLPFMCRRELGPDCLQLSRLLLRKRISIARNLYRRDLKYHYGCVNAIEFSNGGGEYIISGGDDRRVLVWNVQKAMSDIGFPVSMKGEHISNIFCLAFDRDNKKIFSGGNDEQVIVHDLQTGESLDVFKHEDAVYGLSVDPNNTNVFASACDDGRILVYDIREPASTDPFCLANYTSSMHAVMYNPMEPRLLATANAREGLGLWDIRKPKTCCLRYGGSLVQQSCMSVRVSQMGDKVIALRRRLPPVLYHTHSPDPVCEFDHPGYYNSCTMKSCSFAGENDEYVLSGSDDFNLYMWKVPEELSHRQYTREAHMVLKGHRSIVNQVRYNPTDSLIISSGVEKIIKVWSPFRMPTSTGDLDRCHTRDLTERPVYTPGEYINLVLRSGHIMSHDYSQQSTDEDPRMMAFFDSLVQGEMDVSSDDLSSNEEELYDRILRLTRLDIEPTVQDLPDDLSSTNSGEESDFSPFMLAFASVMAAQTAEGGGNSRLYGHDTDQATVDEDDHDANDPNGRKSIAEIIAQNRKEVLKAVETKTPSKVTNSSRTRTTLTSDSDSDDDLVRKRRSLKCEKGKGNNPSGKQKVCQLKRLRHLRHRAQNSDSESSDAGESSKTSKRSRLESETSTTETDAVFSGTNHAENSAVHTDSNVCVSNNNCTKDSGRLRLGPYLHKTDVAHTSRNGSSSDNKLPLPCTASVSALNGERQQDSTNKGSTTFKTKDCVAVNKGNNSVNKGDDSLNKGDDSVNECRPSTSGCSAESRNGSKETFKKKSKFKKRTRSGSGEDSISHENNSDDATENSEPLWTEFKRFKNRLERARRYYRKHSSSQPSSDDE